MVIRVFYCTRGLGAGFFLQFCELLGGLVMSHKRGYSNSATGGRAHFLNLGFLLCFGYMLEFIVQICFSLFASKYGSFGPVFPKKKNPL